MTIHTLENPVIISQRPHNVNSAFDKYPTIDKSESVIAIFQRTVGGNEHTLLLENNTDIRKLYDHYYHLMTADIVWRIAQIDFEKTKKTPIPNLDKLK